MADKHAIKIHYDFVSPGCFKLPPDTVGLEGSWSPNPTGRPYASWRLVDGSLDLEIKTGKNQIAIKVHNRQNGSPILFASITPAKGSPNPIVNDYTRIMSPGGLAPPMHIKENIGEAFFTITPDMECPHEDELGARAHTVIHVEC